MKLNEIQAGDVLVTNSAREGLTEGARYTVERMEVDSWGWPILVGIPERPDYYFNGYPASLFNPAPVRVGDRVRIVTGQSLASTFAGITGVVLWFEDDDAGWSSYPRVYMRPDENRPDTRDGSSFYWETRDLRVIAPEVSSPLADWELALLDTGNPAPIPSPPLRTGDVVRFVGGYDEWDVLYKNRLNDVQIRPKLSPDVSALWVSADAVERVAPPVPVPTYFTNAIGGPKPGDVIRVNDGDTIVYGETAYNYLTATGVDRMDFSATNGSHAPDSTEQHERVLLVRDGALWEGLKTA